MRLTQIRTPKLFSSFIPLLVVIVLLGLTACASQQTSGDASSFAADTADLANVAPMEEVEAKPASDSNALILATAVAPNQNGSANTVRSANRMIIKNGQLSIVVEDTDAAINRAMGLIVGFDGYVIDTRTWLNNDQKYATLTIGIPAEHFEASIQRLKEIGLSVANETISGQDVSDQYVDLQARLRNLEATAARIREFLQETKTVEEALQVSDRLSDIEGQIEQVKGRMNYLQERSAISTITLEISPERHIIISPASRWRPGQTVEAAWASTLRLFQFAFDALIWLVVVVLPCLVPVALVGWLGWTFLKRLRKPTVA